MSINLIQLSGALLPTAMEGYVVESKYVKGGYVVVQTEAERNALLNTNFYEQREALVDGSLVYVVDIDKSFRYRPKTGEWEEVSEVSIKDLEAGYYNRDQVDKRLSYKADQSTLDDLFDKVKVNTDNIAKINSKVEGLTGAMHFVGVSLTNPTTGKVIIDGAETIKEFKSGDVCLYGNKEYVYDGKNWIELGDEGSHLTKEEADKKYAAKAELDEVKGTLKNVTDDYLTSTDKEALKEEIETAQTNAITVANSKTDEKLKEYTKTTGFKTINGQSIVGEGNILVGGGGVETTNDYTDADKEKLAGIEPGAQVNKIDGIVAGTGIEVTLPDESKSVQISVKLVSGTGDSESEVMSQKAVTDELTKLWAEINYVAPTISTFSLIPSETSHKLPATFKLSQITHSETNIANIKGNLTLSGAGITDTEIEPSETSTSKIIEGSQEITLTPSGISYTLSGVDQKDKKISKTVNISAYYTSYFGASDIDTIENDDGLKALIESGSLEDTNSYSLAGTKTVTIESSKWIWFVSTKEITSVKSGGFDVPLTKVDGLKYNGATYKCYRTEGKVLPGENIFVIA